MTDLVQIVYVGKKANVRMLQRDAIQLMARTSNRYWVRPDGDGWCYAVEDEEFQWNKDMKNPLAKRLGHRGSRKQRAARAVRPIEIVKVHKVGNPQPVEVVEAIMNDAPPEEVRKVQIEARIREIMSVLDPKKPDLTRLVRKINNGRTKV